MSINGKWYYIPLTIIPVTLWGSAFAGAKIGFEYMPPIMLSGIRFMLAGLLLTPIMPLFKSGWRDVLKHWKFIALFAMVQTFLQYGLFYTGLNYTPGSLAAIINGAAPLLIALLAHFTLKNDKLTLRSTVALLLGVLGVAFISFTPSDDILSNNPHLHLGIIILIISCLIGSYTNIMVVKYKGSLSPVTLTMGANLFGGIMLLLFSFLLEPTSALTQDFPLEFYLALLWLSIIPAAGFSIWYWLLSRPGVKVSSLNVWKFLIPIVGVVFSWWLLPDDKISIQSIIGIIIITLAVLIYNTPTKRVNKKVK